MWAPPPKRSGCAHRSRVRGPSSSSSCQWVFGTGLTLYTTDSFWAPSSAVVAPKMFGLHDSMQVRAAAAAAAVTSLKEEPPTISNHLMGSVRNWMQPSVVDQAAAVARSVRPVVSRQGSLGSVRCLRSGFESRCLLFTLEPNNQ